MDESEWVPQPGEVLEEKWQILELLGSGASASVFLGKDLGLGRDIAIKILSPQASADPRAIARFEREAWARAFQAAQVIPMLGRGLIANRMIGAPHSSQQVPSRAIGTLLAASIQSRLR